VPDPARARYDEIGSGYSAYRRPDPRLAALITTLLDGCASVVNVGAGTGSYEPTDRLVVAIEPSDVMAAQRPTSLAPALRLTAGDLRLRDRSVDAALAVLTVHHWADEQEAGVRELRRVARGPVVIVTFDVDVSSRMWLAAEYLPEVVAEDRRVFPTLAQLTDWLGPGGAEVHTVPVDRDSPDWTFAAFWAHPERVLDPGARAATSGLARTPADVVDRAVTRLAEDLRSGEWDRRFGSLRDLDSYDAGLRVLVHRPPG
jgi:SAM-dependent methyltransferase